MLCLKRVIRWYRSRSKKLDIGKIVEIYNILNTIVSTTSCGRALIIHTHNGGGPIRPGGKTYVSVLYEVASQELPPISDKWTSRRPDAGYMKIIQDLYQSHPEPLRLQTETLHSETLKTSYCSTHVKESWVYLLSFNTGETYYLSLNRETDEPLTIDERLIIDAYVSRLTNIFTEL